MSGLVNQATHDAVLGPSYETVSNTLGATALALLLVLLVVREAVRVAGGAAARRRLRALSVPIAPLFLTFIVVVAARYVYVIS